MKICTFGQEFYFPPHKKLFSAFKNEESVGVGVESWCFLDGKFKKIFVSRPIYWWPLVYSKNVIICLLIFHNS